MTEGFADNRRVAKNTLLLYFRMIVLTVIGLFTSRVILQVLGVEGYGIHNAIAGFLSVFGIITGSMSNAISRFITVELGKGDSARLKQVFSTSITVQLCMGVLIVLLIESFGIWFLNNKMQIPPGRDSAAQWCLHCATLTTLISLMNVPFNSAIVAHEKMSAFANMTILDAVMKLGICYLLYVSPFDKLKLYAVLLVAVSAITTSIYWIYCLRKFEETSFRLRFDRKLFAEMWGFAGWNLFGQASWILNTQGINMLMNIFFGVVVNAARGVAVQVNGILSNFVNNFMMALNPQITKSYASGDKETAFRLACRGCRFSFYIMYILALPIMLESHAVLDIWLDVVPGQADTFVIWTMLSTLATLLGNTLVTLQMAHGDIRKYQLWMTVCGSLPFPLTWVAFKVGAPAIVAYFIYVAVYWELIFVRYILVHEMTGLPSTMYLGGVVLRTHLTALAAALIPLAIRLSMPESTGRLLAVIAASLLSSAAAIYLCGLDRVEKSFINRRLAKLLPIKSK